MNINILKQAACLFLATLAVACSKDLEPAETNKSVATAANAQGTVRLSLTLSDEYEEVRSLILTGAERKPNISLLPDLSRVGVHAIITSSSNEDKFPVYTNAVGMGQADPSKFKNAITSFKYEDGKIKLSWSDAELEQSLKDNTLSEATTYKIQLVVGGVAPTRGQGRETDVAYFTRQAGTSPNPDVFLMSKNGVAQPQTYNIPLISDPIELEIGKDATGRPYLLSQKDIQLRPYGRLLAIKPFVSPLQKGNWDGTKHVYPKYKLKAVNISELSNTTLHSSYYVVSDRIQELDPDYNLYYLQYGTIQSFPLYTNAEMTEHPVLDGADTNSDVGYFYLWISGSEHSYSSFAVSYEIEPIDPVALDEYGAMHTAESGSRTITVRNYEFLQRARKGAVTRVRTPVYLHYTYVSAP